jgi:peptidoglycan/xylan/chitin deacetylase (PgdA/CDA1 family)/uncharacterized caspase-like protein
MMFNKKRCALIFFVAVVAAVAAPVTVAQPTDPVAPSTAAEADTSLINELQAVLAAHRKIVVLLADEHTLDADGRKQVNTVGQAIFHDKLAVEAKVSQAFSSLIAAAQPGYLQELELGLDYIESGKGLYDADRLAFHGTLIALQAAIASDSSLPAIKLHKRVGEDLDALNEIERVYNKEITQIFSRFDARAIVPKRERWEDYIAHVSSLYRRDELLKTYGVILPYAAERLPKDEELFGDRFPAKTIALTFDDGPHAKFTEEITAILKQYNVPGTFFEVGRNLGAVAVDGSVKLGKNAGISRKLLAEGYAVGNHSYTHAQLAKLSGAALKEEINNTDALLKAVDEKRTAIFRFPYGARNDEGLQVVENAHLRSIMWNIDSLDWADPVPSSVADRVLREVDKQGRGIILFHDIHERAVKALPLILDRLVADGYQFAGWDGNGFSVKGAAVVAEKYTVTTGYANSLAVVIGINDYAHWPKLQYAVNDAVAVRQTLIDQFGFAPEHILLLQDGEATRQRILAAFNASLVHGDTHKNDRIFVFYAGHGATRKLSSGRDIGYIIPVDANPDALATDAIPMTEIQNIAESFTAKHVLFVMDACYSGLGLTRGGSDNFLRQNAKRLGRQMLTAGGADQMVADGGPDGHSIFTWTLLQGLNGKADMNGDGMITATELAAFVAPAVAGVSLQTPAFGSMPGSEGGEFVFELAATTEFISEETSQLSGAAIALNTQQEAVLPAVTAAAPGRTPVVAPVQVKDLQGKDQMLKPTPALNLSARQLAQRANDRGLQLYKEKRYAEAEQQFTEALKLRPDFALAANNLGFIYYKQNQFAVAARWFEMTLKADPSRAIAYLNLGDAYAHANEPAKAEQAYRTYLALAPTGAGAEHVRTVLEAQKNSATAPEPI